MLEKCTEERNDRDDVNFEMFFDYEFVEDFYVDRSGERQANATNVVFREAGRSGSLDRVPGAGRGEEGGDGETAAVELREVAVVVDGKGKVVHHAAVDETDSSPYSTSL